MEIYVYDLTLLKLAKLNVKFNNLKYKDEKEKNMLMDIYCKNNNLIRLSEDQFYKIISLANP